MSLQPFTQTGVDQKLQELYILSDAALQAQVQSIYQDVSAWMNANFTLTTQQQGYLASAPPLTRLVWAGIFGIAISCRRPITVYTPPNIGLPRRTKKTKAEFHGALSWFPPISGPGIIEGNLTVVIDWELVD